MKDKGHESGNVTQFAQKDGVFGGLKRLHEGIERRATSFKKVPGDARIESKYQRESILKQNGLRAKASGSTLVQKTSS